MAVRSRPAIETPAQLGERGAVGGCEAQCSAVVDYGRGGLTFAAQRRHAGCRAPAPTVERAERRRLAGSTVVLAG